MLLATMVVRFRAANQCGDVSYRTVAAIMFHVVAAFGLSCFLFFDINKWAGMFLAWATACMFIAGAVHSNGAIVYTKQSFEAVLSLCMGCFVYALIVTKVTSTAFIKDMMVAACLVHIVFLMGRMAPGFGLMGTSNDASGFIAICAPAFFRPGRWPFALYLPFGLFFAHASGGVIATGLSIVVWALFSGFMVPHVLVAATGAVLFYTCVLDRPGTERLDYWRIAWTHAKENHWWLGLGPGNWKVFFAAAYKAGVVNEKYMVRVHNQFLETFLELGLGWAILLAGYVGNIIKRIRRNCGNEAAGLVACACVCCFNSAFSLNAVNGLFIVAWLAMTEIALRKTGDRHVVDRCSSHIKIP